MPEAVDPLEGLCLQLAQECPFWTKEDWRIFFGLSPPDQDVLARGMGLAALPGPSGKTGWEQAVTVLGTVGTIAADIAGVGSAITIIRALV
jgi:hypothetical protein